MKLYILVYLCSLLGIIGGILLNSNLILWATIFLLIAFTPLIIVSYYNDKF